MRITTLIGAMALAGLMTSAVPAMAQPRGDAPMKHHMMQKRMMHHKMMMHHKARMMHHRRMMNKM